MLWLRQADEFVASTKKGLFTVYKAGGRTYALSFKPAGTHGRTRDIGIFNDIGAAKGRAESFFMSFASRARKVARAVRAKLTPRKRAPKQSSRRSRFGSAVRDEDALVHVAKRAHRAMMAQDMRRALKQANANLHKLLKQNYFPHIPLTDIYAAVERAGIIIDPDERACILTGRQGRASWPITFHGMPYQQHLWITWYKMEQTGRYEVIGAIT